MYDTLLDIHQSYDPTIYKTRATSTLETAIFMKECSKNSNNNQEKIEISGSLDIDYSQSLFLYIRAKGGVVDLGHQLGTSMKSSKYLRNIVRIY